MSYLALYRRFRPTNFDNVFGQDHITVTLKNQIRDGMIGHAYLFTGTRGTGKTSIAKIFAKAVNCETPILGNPCGECKTCKALSGKESMDIVEMDAASNNSVDDIRELLEKVSLQPSVGKYKVYIIDEVHMLSTNAFNALLKTLEEPPKHVIFILATTEPQKVPATILSRCMRFDFRLIPTNLIAENIGNIYKEVGKDAEIEAIAQIAEAGEGSMRDALSIADMCLNATDGKLTYNNVVEILGSLSKDSLFELVDYIISKDQVNVLKKTNELINVGKNITIISKDIAKLFRDVLILKLSKDANSINYPKEMINKLTSISDKVDIDYLLRGLDILNELDAKLRGATSLRMLFETALLKLTSENNDLSLESLNRRLTLLENSINNGVILSSSESAQKKTLIEPKNNEIKVDNSEVIKGKFTEFFRQENKFDLLSAISSSHTQINIRDFDLEIVCETEQDKKYLEEKDTKEDLLNKANILGYKNIKIIVKPKAEQSKEEKAIQRAQELTDNMLKVKE